MKEIKSVSGNNVFYFGIAHEARYAVRKLIKKSSTSPEINDYSLRYKNMVEESVGDVREKMLKNNFFDVEPEPEILDIFKSVSISKKYSMGNCEEMARAAFLYIVDKYPNIRVEIFEIKNGDHVFVVINRDPESSPSAPDTWGKEACICDPWADAAYLAINYKKYLKDYVRVEDFEDKYWENDTEFFDEEKQFLSFHLDLDYEILRKLISNKQRLIKSYNGKLEQILNHFDGYAQQLNSISEEVKDSYGKKNDKYVILNSKSEIIKGCVASCREEYQAIDGDDYRYKEYGEIHEALKYRLQEIFTRLKKQSIFTSEDFKNLSSSEKNYFWQKKPIDKNLNIVSTIINAKVSLEKYFFDKINTQEFDQGGLLNNMCRQNAT